ncbi:MAG: radical SAM/Cys-rich protein [Chlamydiales bacterium]|jgi:radical SAM/Cys-rich protein
MASDCTWCSLIVEWVFFLIKLFTDVKEREIMSLLTLNDQMSFSQKLSQEKIEIKRSSIKILQVNIGKKCNMTCSHCHVDAGPLRTENMSRETIDRLLLLLAQEPDIHTVDITGGAPELNPHFRYFSQSIRGMGKEVIDRCNLTVLFEVGQGDTAQFLAEQRIQIVASLPCYSKLNVDAQRGKGAFDKSLQGLILLNEHGYGKEGTGLSLNLVYNPGGEHLPPPQEQLESDYKVRLREDFGIEFNRLFTITNMPIKRYVRYLKRKGFLEEYMKILIDNFNGKAAQNVMCTELVSISWDGKIYDCDFNQMLEIPVNGKNLSIWEIEKLSDIDGKIAFGNHCYGCTAGTGSSCGGSLL